MKNIVIRIIMGFWLIANPFYGVFAQSNTIQNANVSIPNYDRIDWIQIQTNELTSILKNADPSQIPTNAWAAILEKIDWAATSTNIQNYVVKNVDWSLIPSNLWAIYYHPKIWPESIRKENAFNQRAIALHYSVNNNQLKLVLNKLTNLPALFQFSKKPGTTNNIIFITKTNVLLFFEGFTMELTNNLNEYASYLTNRSLSSYIGNGYEAKIQSPQKNTEFIYFLFWSEDGPVRNMRKMVGDERVAVDFEFYNNSKLKSFELYTPTPNSKYHKGDDLTAFFNESGNLYKIIGSFNEELAVYFDIDTANNSNVRFLARHSAYAK